MGICCDAFYSIESSFHPYDSYRDFPRGVTRGGKNVSDSLEIAKCRYISQTIKYIAIITMEGK